MRSLILVFTILILRTTLMAQPCGMSLLVLSTYVSPCGTCDCSIWVGQSGGTAPFAWSWNTGQTTDSIYGICPGTYICTVTDSANCTSTGTITITSPAGPTLTFTSTDATCDSCCDATATANVSGGTAPYTYLWSDNQTGATDTGLCVAKFICCVTDAAGCTTCDTVEILSATGIEEVRYQNDAGYFVNEGKIVFDRECDAELLDMSGRMMVAGRNVNFLPIEELPPGIYLLLVQDRKGLYRPAKIMVARQAGF